MLPPTTYLGAGILLGALCLPVQAQRQVQKVVASDAASFKDYGARCSIDGDWAFVTAPTSNLLALGAGEAYVLHRSNGSWAETQILLASVGQSGDSFGWSVDMSVDLAVVGARSSANFGTTRTGAAYVFERVGNTWVERQKLVPSIPFADGQFGHHVAISGDRIVVGNWFASLGGTHMGAAYVYERSGPTWVEVARLQPSDLVSNASFGICVAIEGDTIACGTFAGRAAYVYRRDPQGVWALQQKLTYPGSSLQLTWNFGALVALAGNTLFVSSEDTVGSALRAGRAYVYEESGGVWTLLQTLTPLDVESNDGFGIVNAGGNVAVGSSYNDSDQGFHSGASYIFQKQNGQWSQTGKVLANDGVVGHLFGFSPSISGNTLIVGTPTDDQGCAPGQDCNTGAYYFFEMAPTATQYGSCASNSPCGNVDAHGGCVNSTGQGAILQASGSGSVTTDDLTLEVRHLPPFAPTLMFMGGAQSSISLGSGQLVVGGGSVGLYRLGIQFTDGNGVLVRPPGLVAYSQSLGGSGVITAGQTWNFQCWYRDVQTPCAITNNLSNGLSVGFTP
jgi:hypothetical protein